MDRNCDNNKNNNDNNKNIICNNDNNDDNDNTLTSLIPLNKTLISCLNVFKVIFLFIESSNWFHTEGPIY